MEFGHFTHDYLRLMEADWRDMGDMEFLVKLRNTHRHYFFDQREVTLVGTTNWVRRAPPNRFLYILWFNGERVGTIGYRQLMVEGLPVRWLENLALLEEFQGYGLAKWLVDQMREPGHFVVAQVMDDNRKVCRMYREHGFMRVNPRTIRKVERRPER